MAERLSEIEARIDSVRQLSSVIGAVRGIAAARLHEARARLDGIRTYAGTIGQAIAQAISLVPDTPGTPARDGARRRIILALGAEQGFVGGFNGRVLDAVRPLLPSGGSDSCDLFVTGSHAAMAAGERALAVGWCAPMATHADEVAGLANRLADKLFETIGTGDVSQVILVHARPMQGQPEGEGPIAVRELMPFDFSRFPPSNHALPPMIQLPAPVLLSRLADEYVFAEICEALVLSFAAENEARMQAMVAARENVARRLDDLTASARRLRQEQITAEVVELAAGAQAQQ
jgi:F-type H+-transporting ATPase subunit gamma